MAKYEYGDYKPKWYNLVGHIPGVEGTFLHVANFASDLLDVVPVVKINLRRASQDILREEMAIKRVTGKDPVFNPLAVAIYGGIESILTGIEWGAGIAATIPSVGLSDVVAGVVDAAVDTAVGEGIRLIHYRRARQANIPTPTIRETVFRAGATPFIPVVPTLSYLQWYGRALERQSIRDLARKRT